MADHLPAVQSQEWREAVMGELGLNPRSAHTAALFAVAQATGLDPITRQVDIFRDRVYVTRDGYLAHAYRSGRPYELEIDVHEPLDAEAERHRGPGWRAYVIVRLLDTGAQFRYGARATHSEFVGKNGKVLPNADERAEFMALARAERRALKRAFPLVLDEVTVDTDTVSVDRRSAPGPDPVAARFAALPDDLQQRIVAKLAELSDLDPDDVDPADVAGRSQAWREVVEKMLDHAERKTKGDDPPAASPQRAGGEQDTGPRGDVPASGAGTGSPYPEVPDPADAVIEDGEVTDAEIVDSDTDGETLWPENEEPF